MSKYLVSEKMIRIHNENAFIEVGDYADVSDMVELRTVDKESIEFYGKISLCITPEYSIALGKALIEIGESKLEKK